jgi:hypothetical protein
MADVNGGEEDEPKAPSKTATDTKALIRRACHRVRAELARGRRPRLAFISRAFASETVADNVYFYTPLNFWAFFGENQSGAARQELEGMIRLRLRKLVKRSVAEAVDVKKEDADYLLRLLRGLLLDKRPASAKPPVEVASMFARAMRTLAFSDRFLELKRQAGADGTFLLCPQHYPALNTLLLSSDQLGVSYRECAAADPSVVECVLTKLLTRAGYCVSMEWLCNSLCGEKQTEVLCLCSPLRTVGKTVIAYKLWRKVLGKLRFPNVSAHTFTSAFVNLTIDSKAKRAFAMDCGRASLLWLDEAKEGDLQDISAVKALQGTGGSLRFKYSNESLNTEQCYSVGCTTNQHPVDVLGSSAHSMDVQDMLCVEVLKDDEALDDLKRFMDDNSRQMKVYIMATLLHFLKQRAKGEISNDTIAAHKQECALPAFTARRPADVWRAERLAAGSTAGGAAAAAASLSPSNRV